MRAVGHVESWGAENGTVVVALVGEHDMSTAPELRAVLERAIDDGLEIVIDLRGTTFLGASILHALIGAKSVLEDADASAERSGRRMTLQLGSSDHVRRVFEAAGLLERFDRVVSTTAQGRSSRITSRPG